MEPPSAAPAPVSPLEIGPEDLLPDPSGGDAVIARVGGLEIHERHVYEHLLATEPAAARRIVEMIAMDARVARLAAAYGIRLDPARVDEEVEARVQRLTEAVKRELKGRMTYADYLARNWGTTPDEHRAWLRDNVVRNMYREYVLRYLALRQDRVEVRYIANSDPAVLADVAARVKEGADFATLAIQHSEDPNRMEGGLLPPLMRGADSPVAEKAFELEPGQMSEVFSREVDGSTRYYLVFCVRRLPGRDVDFASVRADLDREMHDSPLSDAEFQAATEQLEAAFEALPEK